MATDKQIAANRASAQKCTGPRTEQGKATSSQNAVKTGIDAKSEVMRCESRSEYDLLISEYYVRFDPTVPEARCLVDDLIRNEWLTRRCMSAAALVWTEAFRDKESRDVGLAFDRKSETFCRAQRCLNAAQRNFALALKQLQALQSQRQRDSQLAPALPETPIIDAANEPLNPESVSFPISGPLTLVPPVPAQPETSANVTDNDTQKENIPPIAA